MFRFSITALFAALAPAATADTLPALALTQTETTVSGLSSGAFMAVQLQVAFSENIAGAGVVAGGPFGCSDGNVYRAVRVCMNAFWGQADASTSVDLIQTLAAEGLIDTPDHLAADRVYLFHGQADNTVARVTMDALRQSYAGLGVAEGQITYDTSVDAGHGFVTERGSLDCPDTDPNFLIDCDFDQAGRILNQLYPGLAPAAPPQDASVIRFDQSQFTDGALGMGDTAFAYIPQACVDGATCKLHVALHGCKQGFDTISEDYVRLTGYNKWAEANGIVILYPQAKPIPAPWWNWFGGNPNGCWDWWGYAGEDFLTRNAPQMAAIARMAAALGAPLR